MPPTESSEEAPYPRAKRTARETRQEVVATVAEAGGRTATDTIEGLRKRMESALAMHQHQIDQGSAPEHPLTLDTIALQRTVAERQGSSRDLVEDVKPGSDESVQTVRGPSFAVPGTVRTPSYPFPRMTLRLPRGQSQLSGPRHKPFTLLSPTNTPDAGELRFASSAVSSSESRTPVNLRQRESPVKEGDEPLEDPNFPVPDLYDLVLLLNAEPGLDAWWANVAEILAEAYGAERASLAVPGDMTDLENIPWGQKASFNVVGVDNSDSSLLESSVRSEQAGTRDQDTTPGKRADAMLSGTFAKMQSRAGLKRPPLESRHSIAGVIPDSVSRSSPQRPLGPLRAISGRIEPLAVNLGQPTEESVPLTPSIPTDPARSGETRGHSSDSAYLGNMAVVHRAPHALESESDPLIMRSGVAALFGKRKPVVLTRSFTEEPITPTYGKARRSSRADDVSNRQGRPTSATQSAAAPSEKRLKSMLAGNARFDRGYHESEQPEPSPWSKSPHPSPAARSDPPESPFFNQSARVDEAAFHPEAYGHDYSVNQPVEAIGADCSKTVIHIPLIQPVLRNGHCPPI